MGDDSDEARPIQGAAAATATGAAMQIDPEPHSLQHAIHHKRLQQLHHQSRASEEAGGGGAGWGGPHVRPVASPNAHPKQPLVAIELRRHPDEAKLADLVLPHLRISERAPVRVIDTFLKFKLGLVGNSTATDGADDTGEQAGVGSSPKGRDKEDRTHTVAASSSDATLMLYLSTTASKKRKVSGMVTAAGRLLHLTDRKKNSLTLKDLQVRYQIQGDLQMFYKCAKA
jgi:hypothetical protein